MSRLVLGSVQPQPSTQWVPVFFFWGGGEGGVEWLGLVVYHSLPSSAKVKNEWDYTSSNYAFMACTGTTLCFQEESAILQE